MRVDRHHNANEARLTPHCVVFEGKVRCLNTVSVFNCAVFDSFHVIKT